MSFLDILKLIWIVLSALVACGIYALLFLLIGGGWAYAGSNGCHFQIGVIGYAMLLPPAFLLGALVRMLFRRMYNL